MQTSIHLHPYLSPATDDVWDWADDGDAITWLDGSTVTFREEIVRSLERLAPHGWPPFASLIWLFGAVRGKNPPELMDRWQLGPRFADQFARLAAIPADIRAQTTSSGVLAEVVFSQSRLLAPADMDVLRMLREGAVPLELSTPTRPAALHSRSKALHALLEGMESVSSDQLLLRLQTGLNSLPGAAQLDVLPAVQVRDMLGSVSTDPELSGIARLVRDLMAAVHVPRRMTERDDMALGGVSDISNRGSLDRLLLSELAHDDLTLAVRIALNEALFLRREPPVRQPPTALAVLLDSGVRMWGVPRVLATGVALALIANGKDRQHVIVRRAVQGRAVPVNLLNREGLITHLSALDRSAHPGAALADFIAGIDPTQRPEIVIITTPEAAADRAFIQEVHRSGLASFQLGTVSRSGKFMLTRWPGGAVLAEATVRVDDLLPVAPKPGPSPSARNPLGSLSNCIAELPAGLTRHEFPMLLPVNQPLLRSIQLLGGGFAGITRDRALYQWGRSGNGARLITHGLPPGPVQGFYQRADGSYVIVKGQPPDALCTIVAAGGSMISQFPCGRDIQHVFPQEDSMILLSAGKIIARRLPDGALLGELDAAWSAATNAYIRLQNPFWYRPIWRGTELRLEPALHPNLSLKDALGVFEYEGRPWAILPTGELVDLGTQNLQIKVPMWSKAGPYNAQGMGFVCDDHSCFFMEERTTRPLLRGTALRIDCPAPAPTRSMRVHFTECRVASGAIALRSLKGSWFQITWEEHYSGFNLRPVDAADWPHRAVFDPLPPMDGVPISLRVAQFPNGLRVWLDSRGFLFLRSAPEKTIPELCIGLCQEGSLPVSSGEGRFTGPRFFFGDRLPEDRKGVPLALANTLSAHLQMQ